MVISAVIRGMSNYLMVYDEEQQPYESFREMDKKENTYMPAVYMGEKEIQSLPDKNLKEGKPYEGRMLVSNCFQMLLPYSEKNVNGNKRYLYRTDGMIRIDEGFSRYGPGKEDLIIFLQNLRSCLLELEEYMLKPENLCLTLNSVLYQKEEDRYAFLYIPGYEEDFGKSIRTIMEAFMRLYNHTKKSEVTFLYDIYSRFLSENFTAKTFCDIVETLIPETEDAFENSAEERKESMKNEFETDTRGGTLKEKDMDREARDWDDGERISWIPLVAAILLGIVLSLLLGVTGVKLSALLGGGMVLYYIYQFLSLRMKKEEVDSVQKEKKFMESYVEESCDTYRDRRQYGEETLTQILNQGRVTIEKLVSENGRAAIELTKEEIRIGRSKEENDYSIERSDISRKHALIIRKSKGEVCVLDLGSTNGTYVNEERIKNNKETQIHYGDRICFGTEAYRCM